MRYKVGRCNYKQCNDSYEACQRQYKILFCEKRETVAFYTKGEHNAKHEDRRPCYYGISENVKEILEDLIYNYNSRSMRLHLQLEKLKRR